MRPLRKFETLGAEIAIEGVEVVRGELHMDAAALIGRGARDALLRCFVLGKERERDWTSAQQREGGQRRVGQFETEPASIEGD